MSNINLIIPILVKLLMKFLSLDVNVKYTDTSLKNIVTLLETVAVLRIRILTLIIINPKILCCFFIFLEIDLSDYSEIFLNLMFFH